MKLVSSTPPTVFNGSFLLDVDIIKMCMWTFDGT